MLLRAYQRCPRPLLATSNSTTRGHSTSPRHDQAVDGRRGCLSAVLPTGCWAREARQAGGIRRVAVVTSRTPQGPSTAGASCLHSGWGSLRWPPGAVEPAGTVCLVRLKSFDFAHP